MASYDRLKERAIVLPILAFILLTPPILLVFNSSNLIFGIPPLYIYAFLIWAALVVAGFFLTTALQKATEQSYKNRETSTQLPADDFDKLSS